MELALIINTEKTYLLLLLFDPAVPWRNDYLISPHNIITLSSLDKLGENNFFLLVSLT